MEVVFNFPPNFAKLFRFYYCGPTNIRKQVLLISSRGGLWKLKLKLTQPKVEIEAWAEPGNIDYLVSAFSPHEGNKVDCGQHTINRIGNNRSI